MTKSAKQHRQQPQLKKPLHRPIDSQPFWQKNQYFPAYGSVGFFKKLREIDQRIAATLRSYPKPNPTPTPTIAPTAQHLNTPEKRTAWQNHCSAWFSKPY